MNTKLEQAVNGMLKEIEKSRVPLKKEIEKLDQKMDRYSRASSIPTKLSCKFEALCNIFYCLEDAEDLITVAKEKLK